MKMNGHEVHGEDSSTVAEKSVEEATESSGIGKSTSDFSGSPAVKSSKGSPKVLLKTLTGMAKYRGITQRSVDSSEYLSVADLKGTRTTVLRTLTEIPDHGADSKDLIMIPERHSHKKAKNGGIKRKSAFDSVGASVLGDSKMTPKVVLETLKFTDDAEVHSEDSSAIPERPWRYGRQTSTIKSKFTSNISHESSTFACLKKNPRVVLKRLTETDIAKLSGQNVHNKTTHNPVYEAKHGIEQNQNQDFTEETKNMPETISSATNQVDLESNGNSNTAKVGAEVNQEFIEKMKSGAATRSCTMEVRQHQDECTSKNRRSSLRKVRSILSETEKKNMLTHCALNDVGSGEDNIIASLHIEMQARAEMKTFANTGKDAPVEPAHTVYKHNVSIGTHMNLDLKRTAKVSLKRLTSEDLANFTKKCEPSKDYKVKGDQRKEMAKRCRLTKKSLGKGGWDISSSDSTDSELDNRTKKSKMRSRGMENKCAGNKEDTTDTEDEDGIMVPRKEGKSFYGNGHSKVVKKDNFMIPKGKACAGKRVRQTACFQKLPKENVNAVVIPDETACTYSGTDLSRPKIEQTRPSTCSNIKKLNFPLLYTVYLHSLSTPALCSFCKRSMVVLETLDKKMSQIPRFASGFSRMMLEIQMSDRFLKPEEIMEIATRKKLESHIMLRRLQSLKSSLANYVTEAKLLCQARVSNPYPNLQSANATVAFMTSQINPSFLNAQFGLDFNACKQRNPRPACTTFKFKLHPSCPNSGTSYHGRMPAFVPNIEHNQKNFKGSNHMYQGYFASGAPR